MGKKAFFFGLFVALATAAPQNFFNPSNSTAWGNEFYASSFPELLFDSTNDLAAFKFYVNSTVSPDSVWLYANRTPTGSFSVSPVYVNVSIQGAGATQPDGNVLCDGGAVIDSNSFKWFNASLSACPALSPGAYYLVLNSTPLDNGGSLNVKYSEPAFSSDYSVYFNDGAVVGGYQQQSDSTPLFVLQSGTRYYGPGYTAKYDFPVHGSTYAGEHFAVVDGSALSGLSFKGVSWGFAPADHLYYNLTYANGSALASGKLVDSSVGGSAPNASRRRSANFSSPVLVRSGEVLRAFVSSPGAGAGDWALASLNTTGNAPFNGPAGNFNSSSANHSFFDGAAWNDNASADVSFTLDYARCYPAGSGEWTVSSVEYCEGEELFLDANLSVLSGGSLTLKNTTLYLNQPALSPASNGSRNVTVYSGGSLRVRDSDSDSSTWADASLLSAAYGGAPSTDTYFVFNVEQGASFEFEYSELSRAGYELSESGSFVGFEPFRPAGLRIAANWSNVTNSRIRDCLTGTLLFEASDCNVSSNFYWGNGVAVRVFDGSQDNEFSYNSLNSSVAQHFYVDNASYNNFSGNTAWLAGSDAFYFTGEAKNNSAWYNNASHNGGAGFLVDANSDDSSLYWNNASHNSVYGAKFEESTTRPGEVAYNTFSHSLPGAIASVSCGLYAEARYPYGVHHNFFAHQENGLCLDLSGIIGIPSQTLRIYLNTAFNNSVKGFDLAGVQDANFSCNNASYNGEGAELAAFSGSVASFNDFVFNSGNGLSLASASSFNSSFNNHSLNSGHGANVSSCNASFWNNSYDENRRGFACYSSLITADNESASNNDLEGYYHYSCNSSFNNSNASNNAGYGAAFLDSYTTLNASLFASTNYNKSVFAWSARARVLNQFNAPVSGAQVTVWSDSSRVRQSGYEYSNYTSAFSVLATGPTGYSDWFYVYENVSANDGSRYSFNPEHVFALAGQYSSGVDSNFSSPLATVSITLLTQSFGGGSSSKPSPTPTEEPGGEEGKEAETKEEDGPVESGGSGPLPTPSPTPSAPSTEPVESVVSGEAFYCVESDAQVVEIRRSVTVLRGDGGVEETVVGLSVRNMGKEAVHDFVLEEYLPKGGGFEFATPPDGGNESSVYWVLESLSSGEEKTITYSAQKAFFPEEFSAPPKTVKAEANPLLYLLFAEILVGALVVFAARKIRRAKPRVKETGKKGRRSKRKR